MNIMKMQKERAETTMGKRKLISPRLSGNALDIEGPDYTWAKWQESMVNKRGLKNAKREREGCAWSLSRVLFFATPWTTAHRAALFVEFFTQEYWSGLPFPTPGDLPSPGIEPPSPTLAGRFFYH